MAKDLTIILNTPVSIETKNAIIKNITSSWTQYDGKYVGCRYWSKNALVEYETKGRHFLVHDYTTPIKVIRKLIHELKAPTEKSVFKLLNRVVIGTVVTCEEDDLLSKTFRSSMPEPFFDQQHDDYLNPWIRYRECGIKVVDTLQL